MKRMGRGFTVVELLIVIVVIAILAVITVVGYRGVTNSAHNRATQSYLNQVLTKVELAKAEHDFKFRRYTSAETGTLGDILKSVPISSSIDTTKEFPVIISHGGYSGDIMLDTRVSAYSKSGEILTGYPEPGGVRVVQESSKEASLKSKKTTLEFWQSFTFQGCIELLGGTCSIAPTQSEFDQYRANTIQNIEGQIAAEAGSKSIWPNMQPLTCPAGNTTVATNQTQLGHAVTCYTFTDEGDFASSVLALQARIMYSSSQSKFVNVVRI